MFHINSSFILHRRRLSRRRRWLYCWFVCLLACPRSLGLDQAFVWLLNANSASLDFSAASNDFLTTWWVEIGKKKARGEENVGMMMQVLCRQNHANKNLIEETWTSILTILFPSSSVKHKFRISSMFNKDALCLMMPKRWLSNMLHVFTLVKQKLVRLKSNKCRQWTSKITVLYTFSHKKLDSFYFIVHTFLF